MATPSEQPLATWTKRVYSDSDASFVGDRSVLDTKRRRTEVSDDHSAQPVAAVPSVDNGNAPPLRRRVNPDSLAIRLPADLVRELNAFILPGHTEMPTFAVRKELQERYEIDRRHIYDYFHSKGLRVVKEDRISNLIRGKRMLPSSPSQSPSFNEKGLNEPKRSVSTPRVIAKLPKRRRKTVKNCRPKSGASSSPDPVAIDIPRPQPYTAVNPLDHSIPFENDSNCDSDALDDRSSLLPTIEDVDSFCPSGEFLGSVTATTRASTSTTSRTSPQRSGSDPSLPLEQNPPSQSERLLFYNVLNDCLGPPQGLQECVGTYKAYMAERSRLYFERLLQPARLSKSKYNGVQPIRSTQPQTHPDFRADFDVDFRRWLFPGKLSSDVQAVQTPRDSSIAFPQALMPQQDINIPSCNSLLFPHDIDTGRDTFDDLFPRPLPPLEHSQDDIGSPVLRSEPARSHTLLATKANRPLLGSVVPISRTSVQPLPTSSSIFHMSLSLYDNHLAAISAARTSSEFEKMRDQRHDLTVRSRQVAMLETGRTASRSGRTRTTSAGGGI